MLARAKAQGFCQPLQQRVRLQQVAGQRVGHGFPGRTRTHRGLRPRNVPVALDCVPEAAQR